MKDEDDSMNIDNGGTFEINSERKIRVVHPCGILNTQGKSYYLIYPHPVARDSWQGDNCYRFVGVPRDSFVNGHYTFARHIVTNSFAIEYFANNDEITIELPIWELDQDDILGEK